MMQSEDFELVIGLEVHAQLLTRSKIFSSDSNSFGAAPNSQAGLITLAHPGTLPKLNREVIHLAIRMGLSCQSQIALFISFDRKNYTYPDLPKGYQITQDRNPMCKGGQVELENGKTVLLNRIHVEEDAGKSIHDFDLNWTALDFNRAGTPLIELVTEPCMNSSDDAALFLNEIRQRLRFLKVCDGNMEEGSLRADANVSIRPKGSRLLGKKVEIKNMNSVRNLKVAIDYEFQRQVELLQSGQSVQSETRLFDPSTGKTVPMREKEQLNDYRYFPEPDLGFFMLSKEFVDKIQREMPLIPSQYVHRFVQEFGLSEQDAKVIAHDEWTALFFLEVCSYYSDFKHVANWIMGPIKTFLNQNPGQVFPISAVKLVSILEMVQSGQINHTLAVQKLLPACINNLDKEPQEVAIMLHLLIPFDEHELQGVIKDIIRIYPLKIEEFKKGKKGILAMFMGEVMKRTKGKADPRRANDLLMEEIKNSK